MLACLHLAARGQTIIELSDIDLSGLPQPSEAAALRYWFDDNTTDVKILPSAGTHMLDMSSLPEGIHTIHCQAVGTDGQVSHIASALFINTSRGLDTNGVKAQRLLYWFDDEETVEQVDISEGIQLLDASMLQEGLHTLHYQVLCNNGLLTPAMSTLFLRVNAGSEAAIAKSLRYWYDDEQTVTEMACSSGVHVLDASSLIEGLHTVHYQLVNSNGTLGAPYSSIFIKMEASSSARSLRYWFDDDASTMSIMNASGGTQNLDVSGLLTGLHTLNYQLVDDQGKVSTPVTRLFMKNFDKVIAEGKNRITSYDYWLNKNTQAKQTVTVSNATNPYTLIDLLPMEKEPIRSSSFHFEMNDDTPTIYAKNTLRIRFHDAAGYFNDGDKPFVDYSVNQVVEPVGELQNTQTFEKVAENEIRWYALQAAPGDTTAFRLSQAATVQMFSPSGKEVFKATEDASVRWTGIHTWEDGTYYLAVHDVTGSQPTMTLDYMHMDKYDVVDWDVHTVGNGGCSTITFQGNGFRDLYGVDLYTAEGDTIHSVSVSHDSDAETAVTFDFTGATLDIYDAVFHFTEEDKLVSEVVAVEEAVDIELAMDVSYPSVFLRGSSVTYTIKITNKGNMTAYAVPLDLRLQVTSVNEISKVQFGANLNTISIPQDISSNDSIDEEILSILHEEFENANDLSQFVFYRDSVEGIDYGMSQFIIDLSPNSTETFTVTIYSSSDVYLDALVSKNWLPLTLVAENSTKRSLVKRKISREELCCNRTKIECVADVIANITGVFMPPGANCATSLALTGLETAFDVWCSDGNTAAEKFEKYLQSEGKSLSSRLVQSAISCVTFFFNNRLKALRDERVMAAKLGSVAEVDRISMEMRGVRQLMQNTIKSIYEGVMTMVLGKDCIDAFTKPIPGCPPIPPAGGSSTPVSSLDPNDIYGYLSDAGSKFIADSVARVHYTIEFENDTAFATAAAHTIVVKDTLDRQYFDLTKFLPTGINIGSRQEQLTDADITTSKGVTTFVKTIDMRPEIYAIAQVEGTFNQQTGVAEWQFTSLDPMTMEETDDVMQGILPVNHDGKSGIGEVMFEIGVKAGKADGTEIANRAGIVFDTNEKIITPTWVNTVDAIAPTSTILGAIQAKADTLTLRITGEDNRSGVWKYEVYAQMGEGTSWEKMAETLAATADSEAADDEETETLADVRIYEGIEYGFLVLATDSAGNVERKSFDEADFKFSTVMTGDANGDGTVDVLDVVLATSYYLGNDVHLNFAAADVVADGEINSLDIVAMQNIYLNASNGVKSFVHKRQRKLKTKKIDE